MKTYTVTPKFLVRQQVWPLTHVKTWVRDEKRCDACEGTKEITATLPSGRRTTQACRGCFGRGTVQDGPTRQVGVWELYRGPANVEWIEIVIDEAPKVQYVFTANQKRRGQEYRRIWERDVFATQPEAEAEINARNARRRKQ